MGAIAEAFTAYAQPLLDQTDGSLEELQKALSMSQLCYNLALLPADHRDEAIEKMRVSLSMDDSQFDEFRNSFIIPMIERHQRMFPGLHRSSSTDALGIEPFRLDGPVVAATTERPPAIDRYGPCPCNSGEKYKFCCGKKRR